ncbi:unnamed protein product [Sphagnum jensenii]
MDKCTGVSTAWLLIAVLGVLCNVSVPGVLAENPPGSFFVNCGSTDSYVDKVTGITWMPDDQFIDKSSGVNANVANASQYYYPDFSEFTTLRYFPDSRAKNCYSFPVTPNETYQIRGTFFYGNYDNQTTVPSFQMGVDGTIVASNIISELYVIAYQEITYVPQRNVTFLCLSRDLTNSVPFISAISLVNITGNVTAAYRFEDTSRFEDNVYMGYYYVTQFRWNFGGNGIIRYPGDIVDHYWFPIKSNSSYVQSTAQVEALKANGIVNARFPPEAVMNTALTTNGTMTINIPFTHAYIWFMTLYLAELNPNATASSREFYVGVPGYSPTWLENPLVKTGGLGGLFELEYHGTVPNYISLFKNQSISTALGPLVNALEIFELSQNQSAILTNEQDKFAKQQVQPTLYSYNVLSRATGDFHQDNKLGEGGFGVVYKGILLDGTTVAIKLLTTKSHQGIDDFLNEVVSITGVRHKNLVKLKGCCLHRTQRLLVYEYVENKNLAEALWGSKMEDNIFLDWPTRFHILVGIARGLVYLHEDLQPCIIHRDIKASNILLDNNLNAKIADFGLARLFSDDQSKLFTQVAGTIGYMSPEYATLGQLSTKVDVYSFGILLLEIISGRKAILQNATTNIYLVEWAWSLHKTNMLISLVDQKLHNIIVESEMRRVINVALLCVQVETTKRPIMSEVLSMLQGEMDLPNILPNSSQINVSNIFGILLDGTKMAVKLLTTKSHQGIDDFLNEVVSITSVRHKNLVKLKGCCLHRTQRLLVYEYVENKNLAEALWGSKMEDNIFLDWPTRFHIFVGIARGLVYLHEDLQPCIIHRDIKASNILLDNSLNAKIADFGLARLFSDDQSQLFTQVVGTIGYMSPEYATLGQLSTKVDVYSFGILLLEIISGRKVILQNATTNMYLVEWAWSLHKTNMLISLVDQKLHNTIVESEMRRVINVALLCVQVETTKRPIMSEVLSMLQGETDLPNILPSSSQINVSSLFLNVSINESNHLLSSPILNNYSNAEVELTNLDPR